MQLTCFLSKNPYHVTKIYWEQYDCLGIEYSLRLLLTLCVFVKVISITVVLIFKVTGVEYSIDSQSGTFFRVNLESSGTLLNRAYIYNNTQINACFNICAINYFIVGESISNNYVCLKGIFCSTSIMFFLSIMLCYTKVVLRWIDHEISHINFEVRHPRCVSNKSKCNV